MKEYSRNCPKCNKIIEYSQSGFYVANKNNSKCKKCANNDPAKKEVLRKKMSGINNPFFGKKHSEETKKRITEKNKTRNLDYITDEYRKKISATSSGKNNNMYGKSIYDVWLKKYGKEQADLKMQEFKRKQSFNNSGSKNNMYGRPSPLGSGIGWKGWYKDIYFRSLREVSYMLILDSQNTPWKPAENIVIKYINWDGKERTYRPDFIVDGSKIVEIKPLKMQKTPNIQCKTKGAIEYCDKNNLTYELTDPKIESEQIKFAYNNGLIKFHEKYEERFLNYITKNQTSQE